MRRQIEPELLAEGRDRLGRGRLAQNALRKVAGQKLGRAEDDTEITNSVSRPSARRFAIMDQMMDIDAPCQLCHDFTRLGPQGAKGPGDSRRGQGKSGEPPALECAEAVDAQFAPITSGMPSFSVCAIT